MGIDCSVVTNRIDLDEFAEDEPSRCRNRVLWLPRKNPADIAAIRRYSEMQVPASDLEWIEADGLHQADLVKEYQKADVFLSTGCPEGFGRPPIEAMACGCAVVGFTGGGASEFMVDGTTALVAPDGDCVQAADALARLLTDETLKERIRHGGREIALRYGIDRFADDLSHFYTRVVGVRQAWS